MGIQVNGNAGAVNWEALLGKIGEVTKTEGADGVAGTTNVTITTRADGVETPVTISIPNDLEIPTEVDQAAIDSLCSKLAADTGLNLTDEQIRQFHDTLSATLQETLASASSDIGGKSLKGAMFDLYKLMALLVEVAQKQRDASREMRLAENMAIQKSILDQASAQREAAMTGMIAGAICCAMQVVATGFALYQQSKAFNAQLGTERSAGLDVARQNVNMLETANNQANADSQLMKVKGEVGEKMSLDGHTSISTKVEGSFNNPEFNKASAQLAEAKNALQTKSETYQEMKTLGSDAYIDQVTSEQLAGYNQPELAGVKSAVQKLDAFKAEMEVNRNQLNHIEGLTQADKTFIMEAKSKPFGELSMADKTKLMNLQARHPELNNLDFTSGGKTFSEVKADVRTAFADLNAKLEAQIAPNGPLRTAVDQAAANFRAQTQLEMQKFETTYNSALQNYNEARTTGTKAELAAAETKLQTAGDQLKYARAYGNAKLMQPDVTDAKTHLADVEVARTKYATAQNTRANSVDYIKASNTINKAQATNNLISAIGSFAQGFVQNLTQMQQARATEVGAEQKKAEEELDQTRDLFNQAEELVNSIVQLMNAVRQAEVQSMRDAIQA